MLNPRNVLARALRPFGVFRDPTLGHSGRWITYSVLIGIVSGIGAILFDLLFRLAQRLLIEGIGGFLPPSSGVEGGAGHPPLLPWLLPVSLVLGALISGILVFGFAPEAEGHGTDAVIRSFHHLGGRIRRRVPIIKAIASAVTIGSGGSAGREGPIAQIGAGFGSYLADVLGFRDRDRRVMMMAGVAGGIGSIFRAPLGAALFAAEVLYSKPEFEYEVLLPGLISSITGFSVYCSYAGWGCLFNVPPIAFHEARHLLVYVVLGLVCAVAGAVYPPIFYGVRDLIFKPLPVPRWIKPAIGALALGCIAVAFPPALGMGYGYVQEAIGGHSTIAFLLLFAAIKVIATSLTISSGGSGGVFGPSLVIGGALGGAFGQAAALIIPSLAPPPVACIMVGMGGFFAGVAKTPFAAVIMVMEMTGSYGLLVPSLVVAALAYLILPQAVRLYENQVPGRIDSPAHLGSFAVDILRATRIGDAWAPAQSPAHTVDVDASMSDIVALASESQQNLFPVVDSTGALVGEITLEDLRGALPELGTSSAPSPREGANREGGVGLVARDVMHAPVGPITVDDNLTLAARLLAGRSSDALTIVDGDSTRQVLGLFARRDLIIGYGHHLDSLHHRATDGASVSGTAHPHDGVPRSGVSQSRRE